MPPSDRANQPDPSAFRFHPLPSAAFELAGGRQDFLIDEILVCDQPAVLGGPKKSLKTSLCVDLAVSVATATPFLGRFAVRRSARVAVLSGENGNATLVDTVRRVCAARGVLLADVNVLWQTDLPRLSHTGDRRTLTTGLRDAGVGLVIIDPLYLCLLRGSQTSPANLYEMGTLLYDAAAACLAVGVTPLFVHHTIKHTGASGNTPLALDDLAFAGIGEFARQWILVSRRDEYRPETGNHDLNLSVGGSAGHSGQWRVQVSEGRVGTDLHGRNWAVTVGPSEEGAGTVPSRQSRAVERRSLSVPFSLPT